MRTDRKFMHWFIGRLRQKREAGAVTPPDIFSSTPAEASDLWQNLDGDVATNTTYVDNGWMVINGATAPEQALAYEIFENLADAAFACRCMVAEPGADMPSFLGAVRMQDANNFIGWRAADGGIQLYERIGGVFNLLSPTIITQTLNVEIIIIAVVDQVEIRINGKPIGPVPTAHLTPGKVGMVARAWGAGQKLVTTEHRWMKLG